MMQNVAGSALLAERAAAAGVRRFLFLSSVKVNGDGTQGQPTSAKYGMRRPINRRGPRMVAMHLDVYATVLSEP